MNLQTLTPPRPASGIHSATSSRWTLVKRKTGGTTRGFVGRDESGRKYLIKPDRLVWPELGYYVPPVYLTTISGTGDPFATSRRAKTLIPYRKQPSSGGNNFHKGSPSFVVLFKFSPHTGISILVDFHVNHVRPTADRAVLDVLLG